MAKPEQVATLLAQDTVDQLGRHRILRLLSSSQLRDLLRYATVATLRRRQYLFREGDRGTAIYAVLEGYLKLTRTGPTGREVVLELVGPTSLFGEIAAIGGVPRAADAVALSACRLLAIDARQLVSVLRHHQDAMLEMFHLLTERLRNTTAQMEDLLFLPLGARLARALIRMAALHARPTKRGLQIDVTLSQRELGELTGLARESINKQLAAWRDDALIEMSGTALTLRDIRAMTDIAGSLGGPAEGVAPATTGR